MEKTAFGATIRRLRHERGWSQARLAKEMAQLGVTLHPSAVAKVESGDRPVPVHEAATWARVFEMTMPELFSEADPQVEQDVAIRAAQYELSRREIALNGALAERNEAQQRLNDLVRASGRPVDDERFKWVVPTKLVEGKI